MDDFKVYMRIDEGKGQWTCTLMSSHEFSWLFNFNDFF